MGTKVIIQKKPLIKQDIDSIQIPSVWHIATSLDGKKRELILEVWHLCHYLKKHIQKGN